MDTVTNVPEGVQLRECLVFKEVGHILAYAYQGKKLGCRKNLSEVQQGDFFTLKDDNNEIEDGRTIYLALEDATSTSQGVAGVMSSPAIRIEGNDLYLLSKLDIDAQEVDGGIGGQLKSFKTAKLASYAAEK